MRLVALLIVLLLATSSVVFATEPTPQPEPTPHCPTGYVSRYGVCFKICSSDHECQKDDHLGPHATCVHDPSNAGFETTFLSQKRTGTPPPPDNKFCACKPGFLLFKGKCQKPACDDCNCKGKKKCLKKKFPALSCWHGELECNYEEGYRWRWGLCLRRCDFCDGGKSCGTCKTCGQEDGRGNADLYGDYDTKESSYDGSKGDWEHSDSATYSSWSDSYGGKVLNTCGPHRRCLDRFCVCKPGFDYFFGRCIKKCPPKGGDGGKPPGGGTPPGGGCKVDADCGAHAFCQDHVCKCKYGFVWNADHTGCVPCPQGQYYDRNTKKCVHSPKTCTNNACPNVYKPSGAKRAMHSSAATSNKRWGLPDEGTYCCPTAHADRQCYYWPVYYCSEEFGIVCSAEETACRDHSGQPTCVDKYLYKCLPDGSGFVPYSPGEAPVRPEETGTGGGSGGGGGGSGGPGDGQPVAGDGNDGTGGTKEPVDGAGDGTSSAGTAYAGVATVAFTAGAIVVGVLFG